MNKRKSITISIPTLNEELNIEKCLKSIFKQRFNGRIDIYVADGGSTDKTREICHRYKVKVLENSKVDAESGKMVGLRASRTEYFMILDADMQLESNDWLTKLIKPLEEDRSIVGSFTRFVSRKNDTLLNSYINLDPIQRDPLFRYLTSDPSQVTIERRKGYDVCEYYPDKIVPAGFCIYRVEDLKKTGIFYRQKFMELDNLTILVNSGYRLFAYIEDAGIYHPFLKSVGMLIRKRIRNLRRQFFNQPETREFTWINFNSWIDRVRILLWVVYSNSLILPFIVGVKRAIQYQSWAALYEPVFTFLTTNLIIYVFLTEKEGRSLLLKSVFKD